MMSKHYPESGETKKKHMKGPRQGIKSTKVNPLENIALDGTRIKIEGEDSKPPAYEPPVKHNDVYFHVWDLSETIYSNDTGALSSICRMSACRFFAQTATFCVVLATCRRHVSVMSAT